ncbi:hypothetical protein OOK41_00195 [Micromonospora sp. NBC_01655]|uniref:hypothetical protein n=1 Tax=Micromonospora sp. NBC_01655 TaxID=2975983 RepID=UPI002250916B|nr:hypothetical protein [Micromonospora sp. NBC_01655]MCX4468751.1 hypothetical protein [Micromonospora sp. NBC_01655]
MSRATPACRPDAVQAGPDYSPLHRRTGSASTRPRGRTPARALPAGPEERTGVMPAVTAADTAVIPAVPASRDDVLAEMRADLGAPAGPLDQWATAGHPTTDTREEQQA